MGEVYIARDPDLRRNVAVKRMDGRLAKNPTIVTRFANEVQITAQLDHPAIIPVYGLEPQDDGTLAYSMKLIRGRTLKQILAEAREAIGQGRRVAADFALPARLEIFLQVCDAIAHAHTRGVIHRDLKPDNIMVGAFHEVIVMDWGIARLMGGAEGITEAGVPGVRAERTQLGLAIGTPRYMSPEQANGRNEELDGASDQYALGLLLFELVSLRVARAGRDAARVLARAAKGEKDALVPLDARARIPRELAAIVRKATAVEPAHRYPDVAALAADVRRFLRDEAVVAEPDSGAQRLTRWVSRNRQTAVALGMGLALLVVVTAGLGVAAALGVREVGSRAAAAREARLAQLLRTTTGQAHRMESRLLVYEGLLQGLAVVAEARLGDPPVPHPYFLADSFSQPGKGPPDLVPARFYDGPVSLEHPDFALAPGVSATTVEPRLFQLAALVPQFQEVHRRSAPEGGLLGADPAAWKTELRGTGVPIVWSYVATQEGILAGYPGSGVYPPAYDPRAQHWYTATVGTWGPHWEPAYLDESGMGLLVTATRALHSPDGALIGVAAVDITIGYLIDTFLLPPALGAPVEAWLVDSDGDVVVRSSLGTQARELTAYEPPPFPFADVLGAIRASPAGGQVTRDGTLFAWSGLETLGWTYVISGDAEGLLGGS
jgi:serine/threonine-protein kinase